MQSLNHLAIIMDGNRRWAKSQGNIKLKGHTEGAKNIKKIAKEVIKNDISYLSLFALSTENLKKRSEKELKHLFSLMSKIVDYIDDLFKNDTKLKLIGDLSKIPEKPRKKLQQAVKETNGNETLTLTLAINYGGRDEIVRAVKKVKKDLKKEVTEENFNSHLDSGYLPDIDLLVRTGNRKRISNFMLWKAAYSEIYFTDVFWPAFNKEELKKAIQFFQDQKRTFGA